MVFAAIPMNICCVLLCQNTQEPTLWQICHHHIALAFQTTFLTAFNTISLDLVLH